MKRPLAVSVVGRDRPGIVAALADAMLAHRANVEDSRMTILRGHLAMTLIVAVPEEVDTQALHDDLEAVRARLGLESLSVTEVDALEPDVASSEATHIVSVYGVDHPGIVRAVATALSEGGFNITDLATRLAGEDGPDPLYAMAIEVAAPVDAAPDALDRALAAVAEAEGVEISSRPLERDTL